MTPPARTQNGNGTNTPRWLMVLCATCMAVATATSILVSTTMAGVARTEVDRTAYPKLAGEKLEEKLCEITESQKRLAATVDRMDTTLTIIKTQLEDRKKE